MSLPPVVSDHLLMRGLYCLLKSDMLAACDGGVFMEEAAMNLHISNESILRIVVEHLREEGGPEPSAAQFYEHLECTLKDGEPLVQYLGGLYEKWIIAKHPSSKHGVFWSPPYSADDVYETRELLISLFRYILLGEVSRRTE